MARAARGRRKRRRAVAEDKDQSNRGPTPASAERAPGTQPDPLGLQQRVGNRQVQRLYAPGAESEPLGVQRQLAAHTPARRVPAILNAEPSVAAYIDDDMAAPTVRLHSLDDFRAAYVAYALRNGQTREQAEAKVLLVAAFSDHSAQVIHLNRQSGDPGTIVHEALHLNSSRSFIESVHPRFNEGATEFFTRRVCGASQIPRSGSYEAQLGAIELLVQHSSERALAEAYFNDDKSLLSSALDGERDGLWLDWLIAMTQSVPRANRLLRPEAPSEPAQPSG